MSEEKAILAVAMAAEDEIDETDELAEALAGAELGAADTAPIFYDEDGKPIPTKPEEDYPPCERHRCFSCIDGKCMALENNDFGHRGCPFYKPFEKARREQKAALQRLVRLGRSDLLKKYQKFLLAMDIGCIADEELSELFSELKDFEKSDMEALLTGADEEDDWD